MDYVQGAPSRPGPEADLVQRFVEASLPPSLKGENQFVFIEPKLGATRPDIVAVYWDSSVATPWPKARQSLSSLDLRLAHLLFMEGPLREEKLRTAFPRGLQRSLEKLDKAGLILYANERWHLRSLKDIFAVHRIVAFEAKISSVSRALEQAQLNTWFASESYVLMPAKQPIADTIERACSRGIGIWLLSGETRSSPLVGAKRRAIPQSYASWFFNEFVWKATVRVD